jgi:hypothetical protein
LKIGTAVGGDGNQSGMNSKRWVIVAAAIFLAGALAGYFVGGQFRATLLQKQDSIHQGQSVARLGPWEVRFKSPASIQLPDGVPVIRFDFGKVEWVVLDKLTVTATNMTDRQSIVSYTLFGYDSEGRRVSEANAEFRIGSHETIVRDELLHTYGPETRRASSFLLVTSVER